MDDDDAFLLMQIHKLRFMEAFGITPLDLEISDFLAARERKAKMTEEPVGWGDQRIDDMTREEAIAALKACIKELSETQRRAILTHRNYREMRTNADYRALKPILDKDLADLKATRGE